MKKSIKLTPELENVILASIRAGGYPSIAAAAWGVSETLLKQWLKMGKAKRPMPLYKDFASKVEQAHAQAQLKAEMEAYEKDPKFWLKSGPGQDPLPVPEEEQTIDLFSSPDYLRMMATIRRVLARYPEALKELSAELENQPVAFGVG